MYIIKKGIHNYVDNMQVYGMGSTIQNDIWLETFGTRLPMLPSGWTYQLSPPSMSHSININWHKRYIDATLLMWRVNTTSYWPIEDNDDGKCGIVFRGILIEDVKCGIVFRGILIENVKCGIVFRGILIANSF